MNPFLAKTSRTLHWMSSALGLGTLLFFAITGVTLNHPHWFSAERSTEFVEVELGQDWRLSFDRAGEAARLALLAIEVDTRWGLDLPATIESNDYEWLLDYQRPGGLTTVVLDIETGILSYERIDDGLVALINDLHKGRHAGLVWMYLIDLVALVCVLFAMSGLVLLFVHARKRSSTWPLVSVGAALPLLLYWMFVP